MFDTLVAGARAWGIELTTEQLERFARYEAELLEWNRRFNLTRIIEPADIEIRHFLDSLAVFLAAPKQPCGQPHWPPPGARIIDVGSGAGFPGIPMLIVRPDLHVTLLDAVGKKTLFLRHVLAVLGLSNGAVIHGRAEDVAHQAAHRECYDVAVARAVAPLNVLAELCLPFCAIGGVLIAQKKGAIPTEIAAAEQAIKLLGGGQIRQVPYNLPHVSDGRALVVVEKIAPTPSRYPRRAGLPERRPL